MLGTITPYQYVVVNEYGGMLTHTLADTTEECLRKYAPATSDPRKPLEAHGSVVVRLCPHIAIGRPAGYWYKGPCCEKE